MRTTLLCSVVVVSGVTTAFAAPAIDSWITALSTSKVSASYRSAVQAKLERSYLDGLERCYLREPKVRRHATVTRELVFEIALDGKVKVVSSSFARRVKTCVAAAVKRWRLGVPEDPSGVPIAATFFAEIELGPPEAFAASRFASMLTVESDDATEGDMSIRRPGADLGTQLAASPTPARISVFDERALDATTLGADVVAKKLQSAYLAGVKRCYATRLATNPSLKGRITLALAVNESGRVVRPTSRGFDKEVDRCIASLMASWRFPVPRDADGEPATARFTLGLAFNPD